MTTPKATPSRLVTSVQERKQELYDEAVIRFEANLRPGKAISGNQRDKLWNAAEQAAMQEVGPIETTAALVLEGTSARRTSARTPKVRIGDFFYDLI
jgi:hypothetical protein